MEDNWEKMTGAELAHILALQGHESALQAALDTVRTADTDWDKTSLDLLNALSADAAFVLTDVSTDTPVPTTRAAVLADELRRAALEEG